MACRERMTENEGERGLEREGWREGERGLERRKIPHNMLVT